MLLSSLFSKALLLVLLLQTFVLLVLAIGTIVLIVITDFWDTMSNRSPKFPLTDTRVAAVRAPHFFTTPTHAPTMHLATQNAFL